MNTRKIRSSCLLFLAMLAGCLLTSCGTALHKAPYNVGVKRPYLEAEPTVLHRHPSLIDKKGDAELAKRRLTDTGEYCKVDHPQELYRIGSAYYVKTEVVYAPIKSETYIWTAPLLPMDLPKENPDEWERATYYCRVGDPISNNALQGAGLQSPAYEKDQPNYLTEEEAAKLSPVFVKKVESPHYLGRAGASALPARYSWIHYAMLPVTAATIVLVDIPTSVIGSIFGALAAGVCFLCGK